MAVENPTDIEVKEALRQVLALRALTTSTGTITTFTQNKLLRGLSPEALTRVAVILREMEKAR
jgi:non-canonical (house-cleaning) NTP pyrophosphatase